MRQSTVMAKNEDETTDCGGFVKWYINQFIIVYIRILALLTIHSFPKYHSFSLL